MEWYYSSGAEQVGPLSQEAFYQHVTEGRILSGTPVWCTGMADWTTYGAYVASQQQPAQAAAAPAQAPAATQTPDTEVTPARTSKASSLSPELKRSIMQGAGISGVVLLAVFLVLKLSSGSPGAAGGGGGGGGGHATVDDLAQAYIKAIGNQSDLAALFPSEQLIRSALDCGGDDDLPDGIVKEIKKERRRLIKKFGELPDGTTYDYDRSEKVRTKELMKAGETQKGCTITVDVEIQKHKVYFGMERVSAGDEPNHMEAERDRFTAIRIGDSGWFMLDP